MDADLDDEGDDDDESCDEEEDYDDGSDNNWKVRRLAVKCIRALLSNDALLQVELMKPGRGIIDSYIDAVLEQLRERDAVVHTEIVQCLHDCLVNERISLTDGQRAILYSWAARSLRSISFPPSQTLSLVKRQRALDICARFLPLISESSCRVGVFSHSLLAECFAVLPHGGVFDSNVHHSIAIATASLIATSSHNNHVSSLLFKNSFRLLEACRSKTDHKLSNKLLFVALKVVLAELTLISKLSKDDFPYGLDVEMIKQNISSLITYHFNDVDFDTRECLLFVVITTLRAFGTTVTDGNVSPSDRAMLKLLIDVIPRATDGRVALTITNTQLILDDLRGLNTLLKTGNVPPCAVSDFLQCLFPAALTLTNSQQLSLRVASASFLHSLCIDPQCAVDAVDFRQLLRPGVECLSSDAERSLGVVLQASSGSLTDALVLRCLVDVAHVLLLTNDAPLRQSEFRERLVCWALRQMVSCDDIGDNVAASVTALLASFPMLHDTATKEVVVVLSSGSQQAKHYQSLARLLVALNATPEVSAKTNGIKDCCLAYMLAASVGRALPADRVESLWATVTGKPSDGLAEDDRYAACFAVSRLVLVDSMHLLTALLDVLKVAQPAQLFSPLQALMLTVKYAVEWRRCRHDEDRPTAFMKANYVYTTDASAFFEGDMGQKILDVLLLVAGKSSIDEFGCRQTCATAIADMCDVIGRGVVLSRIDEVVTAFSVDTVGLSDKVEDVARMATVLTTLKFLERDDAIANYDTVALRMIRHALAYEDRDMKTTALTILSCVVHVDALKLENVDEELVTDVFRMVCEECFIREQLIQRWCVGHYVKINDVGLSLRLAAFDCVHELTRQVSRDVLFSVASTASADKDAPIISAVLRGLKDNEAGAKLIAVQIITDLCRRLGGPYAIGLLLPYMTRFDTVLQDNFSFVKRRRTERGGNEPKATGQSMDKNDSEQVARSCCRLVKLFAEDVFTATAGRDVADEIMSVFARAVSGDSFARQSFNSHVNDLLHTIEADTVLASMYK